MFLWEKRTLHPEESLVFLTITMCIEGPLTFFPTITIIKDFLQSWRKLSGKALRGGGAGVSCEESSANRQEKEALERIVAGGTLRVKFKEHAMRLKSLRPTSLVGLHD